MERGILAGHDLILLGERGQAKTRLIRNVVGLLDEEAPAIAGGPDGAAERMLRVFLSVWDDPEARLPLLSLVRGMFDPSGRRLLAEGFLPAVLAPVGVALGLEEPERRMPLLASQVLGLIVVRYVLELEPVASMTEDDLVAIYAPTLQTYLTGPLPH